MEEERVGWQKGESVSSGPEKRQSVIRCGHSKNGVFQKPSGKKQKTKNKIKKQVLFPQM